MNTRGFFAVMTGCLLMVTVAIAQVPDDPLADVERLYASAAFEDALAVRVGSAARSTRIGLTSTVPCAFWG